MYVFGSTPSASIALFITQCLLLSVIQNSKGLGKTSIFLVGGFEIRLVNFFKEHLVILDSQPIIPNDHMLYLEFFVCFLLSAAVCLGEMGYHENVFLN